MYDFKKLESKWQKSWLDAKIFQPKIDKKKKKFFFTITYPYISGSLHLGHGRAAVEGDIYCRYKRMLGYNVLFPLAFHITGTPVLGISNAIANNDENKIRLYESYVRNYVSDEKKIKSIVKSFTEPWNIVNFFIPKMVDEYNGLGLSVDWSRRFTSGDIEHQKLVTWQFNNYKKLNYLIKASYPVLYCPLCKNAVGEDDIQDADINPVEKLEFTLLKLELEKNTFLIAATLRPETIYGQTNIWINPNADYVKININNEYWIVSKEAYKKLLYQKNNVSNPTKVLVNKLIGKYVLTPGLNKKVIILPSLFVDPNFASGIVTSVPSDAPYDLVALNELKNNPMLCRDYNLNYDEIKSIEIIPIIRTKVYGDIAAIKVVEKYKITDPKDPRLEELTQLVYKEGFHNGIMLNNCGKYSNMPITKAKDLVKSDLIKENKASIMYETSREAYCRDGTRIIVSVLEDQWFLDFNAKDWKKKARKCLSKIQILPDSFRKNFLDTIDWLDKRPTARRRGIGTKLPFDDRWIIESLSDSTIYMSLYTINNLIKKYKIKGDQLNQDFFDYIFLNKISISKANKSTKISKKILKELRENFDYWYPNDHRHTYPAHLSNHLSFFIFAHSALFPEKYWPKKISFHGMVLSEGTKMSKSKGNIITLLDVRNNIGADIYRFYLSSATNLTGTFNWKDEEAKNVQNTVNTLYSLLDYIIKHRKKGRLNYIGQSFVSRFEDIIKKSTEHLENMRLRDYGTLVIYEVLNLLRKIQKRASKQELEAIYDYMIEKWLLLISPIMPHLSEEFWKKLGKKSFISLTSWPKYDSKKINIKINALEELIENTNTDIKSILNLVKFKPNKINIFIAEKWKYDLFKKIKKQKSKNISDVIKKVITKKHSLEISKLIPILVRDPSKILSLILNQEDEFNALQESKNYLEKEFKLKVDIIKSESSQNQKAKQALPFKPAIYVE